MLHSTKYHPIFDFRNRKMKQIILLSIALVVVSATTNAQSSSDISALRAEIASLDSSVFSSFNNRDVQKFKGYFSEDLEFFHDKGGLTGYAHTIEFLQTLANSKSDLKRELVTGSLEVFPIPGYGAMQIGAHRFTHTENNRIESATFKFVHIWRKNNNSWKITRVISYDH